MLSTMRDKYFSIPVATTLPDCQLSFSEILAASAILNGCKSANSVAAHTGLAWRSAKKACDKLKDIDFEKCFQKVKRGKGFASQNFSYTWYFPSKVLSKGAIFLYCRILHLARNGFTKPVCDTYFATMLKINRRTVERGLQTLINEGLILCGENQGGRFIIQLLEPPKEKADSLWLPCSKLPTEKLSVASVPASTTREIAAEKPQQPIAVKEVENKNAPDYVCINDEGALKQYADIAQELLAQHAQHIEPLTARLAREFLKKVDRDLSFYAPNRRANIMRFLAWNVRLQIAEAIKAAQFYQRKENTVIAAHRVLGFFLNEWKKGSANLDSQALHGMPPA